MNISIAGKANTWFFKIPNKVQRMESIDIAIIINSFNRLSLLKDCLFSLAAWIPSSSFQYRCFAVVYDAGSNDGSLEWLTEETSNLRIPLKVLTPGKNDDSSFAAGLNTGAAYAIKNFPALRYLIFYETDNQLLEAGALSQALTQLEERHRLAACGFTVRRHDGKPAGVGMPFPKLLNFGLGKNVGHFLRLESIPYRWHTTASGVEFSEVDVVYTSPLVVRLDAWMESGGLDAKQFPFSDCDVDWARRLKNLHWKMGVIRSTAAIHDNLDAISAWSKTRAIQSHRGRLRYFKRHHPKSVFVIRPVLFIRHVFEFAAAKILVREPHRREHLSRQFYTLLKSWHKDYE